MFDFHGLILSNFWYPYIVRLFIAVNVPEEFRNKVGEIVQRLSQSARRDKAEIKWVKPERFHFTLKFLGECLEEQLPQLTSALDAAIQGIRPFSIQLGGVSCFPEHGPLRIIWLGVREGETELAGLALRVETACETLGLSKETRPFSPHLTLGRVNYFPDYERFQSRLATININEIGSYTVKTVDLIRSVLSSAGPTYTILHSAVFQ